jgi:hypothetical protein
VWEVTIFGGRQIIKEEYSVLPLSLPYEVLAVREELDSLNDNYREHLIIQIVNSSGELEISYTAALPELLGKRISLSYIAATEDDADLIMSYLSQILEREDRNFPSLPAYLIELKPQLVVNGQIIATGSPVTMGTRQALYLIFSHPFVDLGADYYPLTAGEDYVINLNSGRVTEKHLDDKLAEINEFEYNLINDNIEQIPADSFTGDMLHAVGLAYYALVDSYNQLLQKRSNVRAVRMTSAGVTSVKYSVTYLLGIPQEAAPAGLAIDLRREIYNGLSINGNPEEERIYHTINGILSSFMEGFTFVHMFAEKIEDAQSVSTMHVLEYANKFGIYIYSINQENADEILPQLEYDSSIIDALQNYIAAGKTVIIPQRSVTIGGFTGTGLIVIDEYGHGAYIITGILHGGLVDNFGLNLFEALLNNVIQKIPDDSIKIVFFKRIEVYPAPSIKFISEHVGLITTATYVYNIYTDFTRYEGVNRWKAAGITTLETLVLVVAGVGLAKVGLGTFAVVAIGTGIGAGVSWLANKAREAWLNSYYIFRIYIIYTCKIDVYRFPKETYYAKAS